jgi:hypothetical protein
MNARTSEAAALAIEATAFSLSGQNVYAVIDGAAVPGLTNRIRLSGCPALCLTRGELPPVVSAVSPWLVQLERGMPFTSWFLRDGWGQGWGVLALSSVDIAALRRHLRTFMTVTLPDGRLVNLRWYDPRIGVRGASEQKMHFGFGWRLDTCSIP